LLPPPTPSLFPYTTLFRSPKPLQFEVVVVVAKRHARAVEGFGHLGGFLREAVIALFVSIRRRHAADGDVAAAQRAVLVDHALNVVLQPFPGDVRGADRKAVLVQNLLEAAGFDGP